MSATNTEYCPRCGVVEPRYFHWSISIAGDLPDSDPGSFLVDETIGHCRLCADCASDTDGSMRWLLALLAGAMGPLSPPPSAVTARDHPSTVVHRRRRAERARSLQQR